MISSLSLFSYATALWLHSEIFDLKKNMPRLHQLLIAAVVLNPGTAGQYSARVLRLRDAD